MAKNTKTKKNKQKESFIVKKERNDGTSEIIITKSPSKTKWGRVIIAILAFGMIFAAVASLIIVLILA